MGSKPSKTVTHHIVIVTGDKKGSSADNINISVTFTDVEDNVHQHQITDKKHNDFDKGESEQFQLELADLGKISAIGINRDESHEKETWYVDRIEVTTLGQESAVSIFPVHRWIKPQTTLTLKEFDSSLPQHDTNSEQREKHLRAKRETYTLAEKPVGTPTQVEILPKDEEFSTNYLFDIGALKVKNSLAATVINLTTPRFSSLEDMESVYKLGYPEPKGVENWRSDVEFGHQKLAGCNPGLIEVCEQIPAHLAVTPELLVPFLEGKSLDAALTSHKIYIIDLRFLASIHCSDDRKLPGPTCLFYQRDAGELVPITIQLMPEPAEDNPVFTPADPEYTWLAAKMWFNMADCSHHQSVTHLGFTHLLMESVAVCSNRQLSASHPIFKFLAPHFLYLIAINDLALDVLVLPGGWVDETMHVGRTGMYNIIHEKWAKWDLKQNGNLLNDLKNRGVDQPGRLPTYHYRDDAILLWEAIYKYVAAFVNGIYDTADKLIEDVELKAWSKELTNSAKFKSLPAEFTSNEELIEVLTIFIFISSVAHAAANFGQYDQYGFPPNYPAMLHVEMPTTKEALTEEYIVQSLPPKKQALDVMDITQLLSMRGTNELGNFEVQYAYDPISVKALESFQADLKEVAAIIDERNSKRERKYEYLNPREVPNAISI